MILFIVIISIVGVDIIKSVTLGTSSGIQRDLRLGETFDFSARWDVIVRTIEVHFGGIFGSTMLLGLVLYYTMLMKYRGMTAIFIIKMWFISRVLYDIPFQIPAGLALASLFTSERARLGSIAIVVSLLAICVYVMHNLGAAPR